MSTDLHTQLAEYGRFHHSEQPPVDAAEITRDDPPARPVQVSSTNRPPIRGRRRELWAAVAAAVVIGVLVGGVAWLTRSGPDEEFVDQPAPPTTVLESPSTTLGETTPTVTSVPTTAPEQVTALQLPAPRELTVTWTEAHFVQGQPGPGGPPLLEEAEQVFPELTNITVAADRARTLTLVAGLRSDGTTALFVSRDGENWSEVDHPVLPEGIKSSGRTYFEVVQTTRGGLTWFNTGQLRSENGVLGVIAEDQLIDVHDPPWDTADLESGFFLVETSAGIQAIQTFPEQGKRGKSHAWTYLGDGQWSAPSEIPYELPAFAQVADVILMVDDAGTTFGEKVQGNTLPLLASNDGIHWTEIGTLPAEDVYGLEIQAGDSFWMYGELLGQGGGIEIRRGHTTIWISADGLVWQPLDTEFALAGGLPTSTVAFVAGDNIYILNEDAFDGDGSYWVGNVSTTQTVPTSPKVITVAPTIVGPPPPVMPFGASDVIDLGSTSFRFVEGADGGVWVHDFRADSLVRIDASTLEITEIIDAVESPAGMFAVGSGLWVVQGREVLLVDAATRRVTDSIRLSVGDRLNSAGEALAPVLVGQTLWVHTNGESMYEVDLAAREVVTRETVGVNGAWWATEIDGAIWSFAPSDGLRRFDLDTRHIEVFADADIGHTESCCVVTGDAIWLIGQTEPNGIDGQVWRFDLGTHEVTDKLRLDSPGLSSDGLNLGVAAAGAIWIPDWDDGVVYRLDPVQLAVTDIIEVGTRPGKATFSDGAVWVSNEGDGTVSRIDVATRQVTHTIEVGGQPGRPLAFDGATWVASRADDTVTRIQTR